MIKNFSTLRHEVWLPYKYAVGPIFHRFYEGLKERKILGNECPVCRKVYVPARTFCPSCYVDMGEWKEVSQEGEITSWIIARKPFFGMPAEPPFVAALIRLDRADCNFLHLVGGIDVADQKAAKGKIRRGMRVKAVWRDERGGHMTDILYFKPL